MTTSRAPDPVSAPVPIEAALDFVNTLEHSRDADTEHLPTAGALVRWLSQRGLLDDANAAEAVRHLAMPSAGTRALANARSLRAALRGLVDARVHRRDAAPRDLAIVNRWLRHRGALVLSAGPEGLGLRLEDGGDPVRRALARLAEAGARAVATGDLDRLRTCANEDCRWAFYDTSRAGRRRWCDMASCGNRAKARRHRARAAAGATAGPRISAVIGDAPPAPRSTTAAPVAPRPRAIGT